MVVQEATRRRTRVAGRRTEPGWSKGIGTVARLGLAVVWAWAGLAKIDDPAAAEQAVRAYRLLPEALVPAFGFGLPFLELALALLLLVGFGTRVAAALSAVLFLVYIGSIASVWARGISIDCGCFGGGGAVTASQTAYWQEILRDCGFLLAACWLLWRPRTFLAADGLLADGPSARSSGWA